MGYLFMLATSSFVILIFFWKKILKLKINFFIKRNEECRYLASSSKDTTIKIWDTLMSTCVRSLSGHTQSVTCIRWGGKNLIYSSSQDRTIKVWRSEDVNLIKKKIYSMQ